MRTQALVALLGICILGCKSTDKAKPPAAGSAATPASQPRVVLETNHGEIELELFPQKAPKGVRNFFRYTESGAYNGTIFHRVVRGFVIQGGGFEPNMGRRPTLEPLENEADNGLKNERGTVAWARTPSPHSATSQFYINLKDNPDLDHRSKDMEGWGYAVFGRVVRGLEVADKIGALPVAPRGGHATVPVDPAIVQSVRIVRK